MLCMGVSLGNGEPVSLDADTLPSIFITTALGFVVHVIKGDRLSSQWGPKSPSVPPLCFTAWPTLRKTRLFCILSVIEYARRIAV